ILEMKKKAFGSGYFGEWITDEHGLPAYNYTCDQINDPKAIIPLNEQLRSNKEHLHQVGNDRLVGVVSNFGYIQVRQDEGCPKFLNDYDPENNQFAGGFGYLVEGKNLLSTFYSENGDSIYRIFGIGYFRKIVEGYNLSVDQVIFAPYGDDPLLISQVTISNNAEHSKNLRWIEYWGCKSYQFSALAYYTAYGQEDLSLMNKKRREFSSKFTHEFSLIDNSGLLEAKYFQGRKNKKKNEIPIPVYESKFSPKTFLVSLDGPIEGFSTNGYEFFGKGGIEHPDGISRALPSILDTEDDKSAMIIERQVNLEPNESRTLYFAYGYLPEGINLDQIISKYKMEISKQWNFSSECWKKNKILLSIPKEPWVERELLWHNYYLRSAMTYDDYFSEHILSQGHVYQYIMGAQIAARDPLQHTLPFIFCEPKIVKEIIRYILKTVKEDGEIPYGVIGNGMIMPLPFYPSDLELWLLWATSEYVLSTKDIQFLDEVIPTYPLYGKEANRSTVSKMLIICYNHFTEVTGTGKHGLQRISTGDWNDGAVMGHVPEEKHEEVRTQGESVLNAAMAIYVLNKFAELLKMINKNDMKEKVINYAEYQKKNLKSQWNGQWFKRAWFTDDLGWIGDKNLWLEPQPWAIIGDAIDKEWIPVLINNIHNLLRKPSKIGARLLSKDIDSMKREIGMRVNAGIWPSINGTLIWALSLVNSEMAWDEWKENTLAYHAEAFPDIWYGIWSGPDTYNSDLSKYPGQTHFFEYFITGDPKDKEIMLEDPFGISWTDFPVMNLHPHAWPIFNLIHLIGANFTKDGIEITPSLPIDEYYFESPLFGFSKLKNRYSGWYFPSFPGNWTISLKLKKDEIKDYKFLKINNNIEELKIEENCIIITGRSLTDKPLKWELLKSKS
ncbi:MAG: GH36-type glycosyl hydrolase domain-containing protein, partial [Promethearchaeota archaeon]